MKAFGCPWSRWQERSCPDSALSPHPFPEGGGSTEISVEKHPAGPAPRRLGLQDRLFILVTVDWAVSGKSQIASDCELGGDWPYKPESWEASRNQT